MTNKPQSKKNIPPPTKLDNKNELLNTFSGAIVFGIGSSLGNNITNKIASYFQKNDECSDIMKKIEDCKNNYGNVKESWHSDSCISIFEQYEKCKK